MLTTTASVSVAGQGSSVTEVRTYILYLTRSVKGGKHLFPYMRMSFPSSNFHTLFRLT